MKVLVQTIKDKLRVSKYKNIYKNFGYLGLLDMCNMLFPFITYPYLIRVLGAELYGATAFAKAIISYFSILINYGFEISATKSVSVNRNDKEKLSEIVSSVYIIKGLFFVIAFIALFVFLMTFGNQMDYKTLILLSYGLCFYEFLFPHYFYVGIEKMKYITMLTVVSNAIFTLLVFVVIHEQSDYYWVPLLTSVGYLVTGLWSFFILFKQEKLKFIFPSRERIVSYFKEGLPLFASRVSAKIYVNLTAVFIGAYLPMSAVAYYDLANKITAIGKMPIGILSTALYPHVSRTQDLSFVRKTMRIAVALMASVYFIIVLFSKPIVAILGGPEMYDTIPILLILALSVIPCMMSNFYGTQMLASFGYANKMAKGMIITAITYLLIMFLLIIFHATTLIMFTIVAVLVEVILVFIERYYCKKYIFKHATGSF